MGGAGIAFRNAKTHWDEPVRFLEITVENVRFIENTVTGGAGAAIQVEGNTVLSVLSCEFLRNSAESGGAIWVSGAGLSVTDSLFKENTSSDSGGGAIVISQSASSVFLRNVRFERNASAGSGGAVYSGTSNLQLSNCTFLQNTSADSGGAIYSGSGNLQLSNCTFLQNTTLSEGGAISSIRSSTALNNCSFWGNSALIGGAVYHTGLMFRAVNADFWQNGSSPIQTLQSSSVSVTYSSVEGGFVGEGNIEAMPRYRDPGAGDFRPLPDSPLIDAGTFVEGLTEDYRGFPRPVGAGFDIGVAEFYDLDGDLMEDDWEALLGFDPEDGTDGAVDADGDGLTNAQEFAVETDPMDGEDPAAELYVAVGGDDQLTISSELAPWATIQRAVAAASLYTNVHTIHVGPGTYEESISIPQNVTLQGAGVQETRIQHFNPDNDEHFVVGMGEGTAIRDCMVTLPGLHAAVTTLLRIEDVYAEVDNVILDGGDNLFSIGILVSGQQSSGGEIRNSTIRRMQFGIQAVNTGINITENTFDGIRGDAVFIRLPDLKTADPPKTPILGLSGNANSGDNTFGNVFGSFVVNFSGTETKAENNDWGIYDADLISVKIFGPVDFQPFTGGPIEIPGCHSASASSRPCRPWGDLAVVLMAMLGLLSATRISRITPYP